MAARGIRNHNPGNLVDAGIKWEGLARPEDMTQAQVQESRFCVFRAPWWGIRAMTKVLLTYYNRHGLKTVAGIIARYAPAHENPTNNYAKAVASALGAKINTQLNLDYYTLTSLVTAIIEFENGKNPYTWEIPTGIILAGQEPKVRVTATGKLAYNFLDMGNLDLMATSLDN